MATLNYALSGTSASPVADPRGLALPVSAAIRQPVGTGQPEQPEQLFALTFPSNAAGGTSNAGPFVALQRLNPHTDGLPFRGNGWTVFKRVKKVQQDGYTADFWWSNNGIFLWDSGSPNTYAGGHLYIDDNEEISVGGGDAQASRAGPEIPAQFGVWVLQALVAKVNGDGTMTFTYYTDLPSVADADVIDAQVSSSYGTTNPPSPAITWGDSPWWQSYQNERLSGQLGENLIFSRAFTQQEIADQAALINGVGTTLLAARAADIWLGKKGFTDVNDLTCDFGTGRSYSWADPDNKATLGEEL